MERHSRNTLIIIVIIIITIIYQGCQWTFAKITENLRVRAVSQKMNTKRDRKFRKRKMK